MRRKLTDEEKLIKAKEKEDRQEIEHKAFELLQLREKSIPEPNIYWKVGDRVDHGNSEISLIKEVIDNGKIYLLDQIIIENNYGKPYEHKREIYVTWVDICNYRTPEELKEIPNLFEKDDWRLSFSQSDMRGLLGVHYWFGVDFDPDYQRGLVWTMEDKVSLINSVFSNIDIGKFVFIKKPYKKDSPSYEILDGKQRYRTLLDFYEGRFTYKGFIYRDLSNRDKSMFDRSPISWADVNEDKMTLSEKYKYFLRLNTGGKVQSIEHLKKVEQLYIDALRNGK